MSEMVVVDHLSKSYGQVKAVADVSFGVAEGEIFGFLGPNGAGKTTTIEMITGLRRPAAGRIELRGISVWPHPGKTKELIGVQLQTTAFYENLTVSETLRLFAALYRRRLTKE